MKPLYWVLLIVWVASACSWTSTPQPPPAPASPTQSTLPANDGSATPQPGETILYISSTMHIESDPSSWPRNVDAFLDFLQQTTNAGLRWSIGADMGWLEGGERVQEIIQRASAMGVQWDVHTHRQQDRAKAAYLLSQYGVTPTSVVSGMRVEEFDGLFQSLTYQGYSWTPQVVWGGVTCVGHRPGCDDPAVALYRPASGAEYGVHNPAGTLIRVGNTDHQLSTGRALLSNLNAGAYAAYPVIQFTIMIEPEVLQIPNSDDGLAEILAFVAEVKADPSIRFATIEETAQAWAQAGSVPVNFVP